MQRSASVARRGVIYVLGNPGLPGLLKIGKTLDSASKRARELSTPSGVPVAFEVIYDEIVSNIDGVEREIHLRLADYRVNPRREFFRLPTREAIRVVQEVARQHSVDQAEEAEEVEILPLLESRMRRWLRRDLVSVRYAQFSDLCVVKWVIQPDLARPEAVERIFDLRVYGADEGDGSMFDPQRFTLHENLEKLMSLSAYDFIATGLDLLGDEATSYVVRQMDAGGDSSDPTWRVSSRAYDMWGPRETWNDVLERNGLPAIADRTNGQKGPQV